jgi:hypothetical protein
VLGIAGISHGRHPAPDTYSDYDPNGERPDIRCTKHPDHRDPNAGKSKVNRNAAIWGYLERLPLSTYIDVGF